MSSEKLRLNHSNTTLHQTGNGLLLTVTEEHTVTRTYVPKVKSAKVTRLGETNVMVKLGGALQLSVKTDLWVTIESDVMTAALGDGYAYDKSAE